MCRHAAIGKGNLYDALMLQQARTTIVVALSAVLTFTTVAPWRTSSRIVTAAPLSCARGGLCRLGDTGPGGGVVFYVMSTPQWWGQYFEVQRQVSGQNISWQQLADGGLINGWSTSAERIRSKALGMGRDNSTILLDNKIWNIPSKDELDALYNYIATTTSPLRAAFSIGLSGAPYWTSSEASERFAWYQLFHDGTQFTDQDGVGRDTNGNTLAGNKESTKSVKHVGSSFKAAPMRFLLTRAFAPSGVVLPPRPTSPTVPAGGRNNPECLRGLSCAVGDIGPSGGIIFYDAGSKQTWGRWFEAAPVECESTAKNWRVALAGKRGTKQLPMLYPVWKTAARQRVEAKALGMGRQNTALIIKQHAGLPSTALSANAAYYADSLSCGGKDDWFLPSKNELDSLHNVLAETGHGLDGDNSFGFSRGFYWTSSEYNNETAWTQLWQNGQQFDREKWMTGDEPRDKTKPLIPFRVRPIRAFG